MPMTKPLSEIAGKWGTVTPQRQPQYEAGVRNPEKDWNKETVAAESRWKAAMINPKTQKRHADAVAATPTALWQQKTLDKAGRWGQGVAGAENDYREGFAPYHAAWDANKLAPKAGKRDVPGQLARIKSNIDQFIAIKDSLA